MATRTVSEQEKSIGGTATGVETVETAAVDREVGASIIASGIGALVLGLLIIGAELSAGLKQFLTWSTGAGPLSGKTGVAVIAFVVSWVGLHFAFKNRAIQLKTAFITGLVLIGLGLLFSFPPVFEFIIGLLAP